MASNYTEHYKLNQWSPEDKVLRTEFNEDNQKIDEALGVLKNCNCRIYTTKYKGTGGGRSFMFTHKPMAVIVMGGAATWMCAIQGVPFAYLRFSGNSSSTPSVTWGDNSFGWESYNGDDTLSANNPGQEYTLLALLDITQ